MLTNSRLSRFAVVACLLSALACGHDGSDTSDTHSYVNPSVRWASLQVPVCWESPTNKLATERGWVRDAVEGQYEDKTRVHFEGWGACDANSRGIRIQVSDQPGDNPHTKGLGRQIDGLRNGMQLNFTFENWSTTCQQKREKCIESIAVHEFGHAIGIAHEHNRNDRPETCHQPAQGNSDGSVKIGSWDLHSIMNYCNPVYNNNGIFSTGDIRGIAYLYGSNEAVKCRAGFHAVDGNLCENANGEREVYYQLDWWRAEGGTRSKQVNLSQGGREAAAVDSVYFTPTVNSGAGTADSSTGNDTTIRDDQDQPADNTVSGTNTTEVSCRPSYQAFAHRYCKRAGYSQFEVYYNNSWWRWDGYTDADKTLVTLTQVSTGTRIQNVAVTSLVLVH